MRRRHFTFRLFLDAKILENGSQAWKQQKLANDLGTVCMQFQGAGKVHMVVQPSWGRDVDFGTLNL